MNVAVLPIAIFLICVADGITDGLRRKAKTKAWWHTIYHRWEAVVYAGLCAILVIWYPWYWCAELCFFTRLAFFDPTYNVTMGHSLWYNGQGASWTDKLENEWNFNMVAARLTYFMLYGVALFFYLHFYTG